MALRHSFLRIDRCLTLYFFNPLMRIRPQSTERRIPILMYHSISNGIQGKVHPYYETTTSPQVFAEHMKYLQENGYQVISLQDIEEHFAYGKNGDRKAVVITFDDGFRDFYTEAFPVLQSYGFSSTMFLPTGFIGKERLEFKRKECLSWREVRELHEKGIVFGSHTVNHPRLQTLNDREIEFELRRSKEQIEDKTGEKVESFSYPFAFPEADKRLINMLRSILRDSGYKYGVTTRVGTATKADDRFFLKRIVTNKFDDVSFFKSKLNGGYDWVYKLQYLTKSMKGIKRW